MSDQFRVLSSEASELQPILNSPFGEYAVRCGDYFSRDAGVELTEWYLAPQGLFMVLERHGEITAIGAYKSYDRDTAEIRRIWIKSSLRQQGLAARVVQELERRAPLAGYSRIYLTTGFRQPGAVRLYLSQGYDPQFDTTHDPEEYSLPSFDRRLHFTKLLTIADQVRIAWEEKIKTVDSTRVIPARYPMRAVGTIIALFALAVIL